MFFGLTIEKLLLIGVIAALIIGPERLPAAAESLRRTVVRVRALARTAHERAREELGPEVADIDWQRLDPRQYDPRRIIREALLADPGLPLATTTPPAAGRPEAPEPDGEPDARAAAPSAPGQEEAATPAARAESVSTRRSAE